MEMDIFSRCLPLDRLLKALISSDVQLLVILLIAASLRE